MDSHSQTPSGAELLEMIRKMDRQTIRLVYYEVIHAMQARMQQDQEPFE
jgi:hypothetical protein